MLNNSYEKLIDLTSLTANIDSCKLKWAGELGVLSSVAFFVPLMLSNQLITGMAVNASLVGGSLYLKKRNLLPLMVLPSLGVLARGIIFGPMTMYLVYMLPFIWLGNASLILSMKFFHLKMKRDYFSAALAGSAIKFALLVSTAFLLYSFGIIPVEFLAIMGAMQLVTALGGSAVFYPIHKVRKK